MPNSMQVSNVSNCVLIVARGKRPFAGAVDMSASQVGVATATLLLCYCSLWFFLLRVDFGKPFFLPRLAEASVM